MSSRAFSAGGIHARRNVPFLPLRTSKCSYWSTPQGLVEWPASASELTQDASEKISQRIMGGACVAPSVPRLNSARLAGILRGFQKRRVTATHRLGGYRGLPFRVIPAWSENPQGTGISEVARLAVLRQGLGHDWRY